MAIETRRGAGTVRERAMRRVLACGERDGLTVRAMAVRAGMPAGTLAWWRSEIRRPSRRAQGRPRQCRTSNRASKRP